MFKMDDRVVLVTGAGPNIGQAIVRVFAAAGAAVICNDANPAHAAEAAEVARRAGGRAIAAPGDVSSEKDVRAVIAAGEKAFGTIDTLVNNAAITMNKGVLQTTLDEWQKVIDITLTGTFICSKAIAERLVAQKRAGVIVNVASTSGHRGRANAIGYCSAKGGVVNLTRAMAMDLAPHGIRVCSVSPTRTGVPVGRQTAHQAKSGEIPIGRFGQPEDQAFAVFFMASDEAQFITGADLRVDGGSLATWAVQAPTPVGA